jgi:DNA-binding CsgD family transcriptional regulator
LTTELEKLETTEQTTITQMQALGNALDAVLAGSGPTYLCRQVVFSGLAEGQIRGCALFYLDDTSHLKPVASSGEVIENSPELSAWDDSPLAEAIRLKEVVTGPIKIQGAELSVLALPLVANGVPSGLAAVFMDETEQKIEFPPELSQLFSKLGAFYLESLDIGPAAGRASLETETIEEPTNRQLEILSHIDDGMINGEIATRLMVSESTIRQETVRIYKSLGVGNRLEAVKKAKVLGFLPRGRLLHKLNESTNRRQ